jgi:charged multivesicular body protein 2A
MAKDYVRCKKHVQKFYQMRTHLQGVSLQLQTMKSSDAMANAMKNATKAMIAMNRRMNLPQVSSSY